MWLLCATGGTQFSASLIWTSEPLDLTYGVCALWNLFILWSINNVTSGCDQLLYTANQQVKVRQQIQRYVNPKWFRLWNDVMGFHVLQYLHFSPQNWCSILVFVTSADVNLKLMFILSRYDSFSTAVSFVIMPHITFWFANTHINT